MTAEQVFKTLVIALPTGLAVAVLPVPYKLSLKAAAAALGVPRAEMADRAAAERSTGYVIGGISPLGQRKRAADRRRRLGATPGTACCAARASAGCEVALAPADLVRLTNAVTADILAT